MGPPPMHVRTVTATAPATAVATAATAATPTETATAAAMAISTATALLAITTFRAAGPHAGIGGAALLRGEAGKMPVQCGHHCPSHHKHVAL